ncbi:hypothetical protein T265_06328 [Opisthorchis viverrini]|uniref:Uncharacterized protein n=1 Tax=Opisthorchis viverrini TaxID=6198 RepID=A0A075ADZ9_OPIVI|nr:hypothetical protein T265_06328 [Opisthorchis viverrini]KER26409.1 hypothetical protein T265_06328 [Opisthorchis viverrini]
MAVGDVVESGAQLDHDFSPHVKIESSPLAVLFRNSFIQISMPVEGVHQISTFPPLSNLLPSAVADN